jgi:hypothetical protein
MAVLMVHQMRLGVRVMLRWRVITVVLIIVGCRGRTVRVTTRVGVYGGAIGARRDV